jgi:hypothetical protein
MMDKVPISRALIAKLVELPAGQIIVIRCANHSSLDQDFAILAHGDLEHILDLAGMKTKKTTA